jgi:hypothetical protein
MNSIEDTTQPYISPAGNTGNEKSPSMIRRILHRFIPSNFQNIFGLTWRLIRRGKPAGRRAMIYSIGGLMLTPLDVLLQFFERRRYRAAGQPRLPLIFVCGAPRSGTTLTAQVLIKYLPVFFFNNLTSLFPRAPITASKIFGRWIRTEKQALNFSSFYGRTLRLSDPNDALYFWDRWTGQDRKTIPTELSTADQEAMVRFFGAVENYSGQPLLNKNNSLNTYAHLIAEALPTAYFICLDRDPLFLAQSHYVARQFIHGNENTPYGIRGSQAVAEDPIGADRFLIIQYEDFCARPAHWIKMISEKILGQSTDLSPLEEQLPALRAANTRKIDRETFEKIKMTLEKLTSNNAKP